MTQYFLLAFLKKLVLKKAVDSERRRGLCACSVILGPTASVCITWKLNRNAVLLS